MNNLIKSQVTQAEREQLIDLISQIEDILRGKLTSLTPEERKRFGSIRQNNKLLVNKVRDYRRHSPSLSSPDIDWDEFEADFEARAFYENLLRRLASLSYQIESAKILHDYDNYSDSRKDYAYTQYKMNADSGSYSVKHENLKQFFNRSGTGLKRKNKNNEENE